MKASVDGLAKWAPLEDHHWCVDVSNPPLYLCPLRLCLCLCLSLLLHRLSAPEPLAPELHALIALPFSASRHPVTVLSLHASVTKLIPRQRPPCWLRSELPRIAAEEHTGRGVPSGGHAFQGKPAVEHTRSHRNHLKVRSDLPSSTHATHGSSSCLSLLGTQPASVRKYALHI